MSAEPLLSVRDLRVTVSGGRAEAVRGVSFDVARGESVGLVGESGSGKTLTCRAVLGVLAPGCAVSGGSAEFDGLDLVGLDRRGLLGVRGRRIGAVFQDPASYLNPSLPVGGQLAEVLRVKLGLARREARDRSVELLAAMGLRDPGRVYGQYPHELSGGMLQRVLIAIAVSCDPELLIADEATTALDVTVQAEVLELLARLRAERGLSILFVSHDLAVISRLCDRIVVFYGGEIVESGPTGQVLAHPAHPYTEALLRVASEGDWTRRSLEVIPGQPPAAGAEIAGCRFADRCAVAVGRCHSARVPLTATAPGREVRCVRAEEPALAVAGAAL
ncbi:ABC transporter ATP-binding protein [Planobispora takensis]|uniref:ABC transporter ATP-binding protein n=1 Tax=Planobispora takensis TaxID=1367882 RepID=A0A8J3SZA4_9ACTN|nr:ABC transporter ATP-binding protein [Planobispora takensis]GII01458.1 ABC transporter ATP-binding protein [Planobispora takensis]